MTAEETAPTGEWSAKIARYVLEILALFGVLGFPLALLFSDLRLVLGSFRTGVAVSILYLVYKIAQEVHYIRKFH